MAIRDLFVRDLGRKIEGVVKVYDRAALAQEIREFVLTDWTEEKLKQFLDTFTESLDARRKRAQSLDDMGVWISGFFGSGKSHFAKLLGYLLQNDVADAGTGETAIDLFEAHLHDRRDARDVRRRLGEIRLGASVRTVAFEIKSKQTLNNPNSVAEILLSTFYESLGYSDAVYLARIEKRLAARDRYADFQGEYQRLFGQTWDEGRKEHEFNRSRIATTMAAIGLYASEAAALDGIKDAYKFEKITAESVAKELLDWVDAQPAPGGRSSHLVFVIDEMGQFIGDDRSRIEELRALVEQLGNQGKGKVWLVVTSQQALEQVCDRANLQLPLLGKLDARFCVKVGLISDEINKVVGERILKKREAKVGELATLYAEHQGFLSQLADLRSTRNLGALDRHTFVASYPLLPQVIKLAQDIFEALSGFRISGGVRSMIAVTQDVARALADSEVGALASFDQVFDAIEKDLYSQEYLGASGVQAIRETAERVPGTPVPPPRILKVLWLVQRVMFVPRTPEVIAKLLVRDVRTDLSELRGGVEQTLVALQAAGYVARDEASGEYKYLSEKERTIEQAVVGDRAILERWVAYRDAYHRVLTGYRSVYQQIYEAVAEQVRDLKNALATGELYRNAPEAKRDGVLDRYFGAGGPLHLPDLNVGTAEDLLAASTRYSLSALQGLAVGLSGWRSTMEAELLKLGTPPPEPTSPTPPPQKTYEWRPLAELGGRSFGPHQTEELERQLNQLKERLKQKLAQGFTVVVK